MHGRQMASYGAAMEAHVQPPVGQRGHQSAMLSQNDCHMSGLTIGAAPLELWSLVEVAYMPGQNYLLKCWR